MQLDELLRQRKTKARALELLGKGGLKLGEHLEESGEVLTLDPDPGIGHGDFHEIARRPYTIPQKLYAGGHTDPPTRRSKLDGIGKEVVEDLLEAGGVRPDDRHVVVHREFKDLLLLLDLWANGIDGRLDSLPKWERVELKNELARLDFGEVKEIINQGKEVLPTHGNMPREPHLFLAQGTHGRVLKQRGEADDRVQRCSEFVGHVGQE